VLQLSGWLAGDVKESRNGNPTRDLQMAQTEPGIIFCAVRWYLRYSLSLRDVEELLRSVVLMSITQRSGALGAGQFPVSEWSVTRPVS
jgi:hypothetical protein